MGLTEHQAARIWEERAEAEVRSLYFADLAASDVRLKQIINGVSFFLSSGAAATVVAKLPSAIPVGLALVAALAMAYSIAVNLDKRAAALVKLHCQWNHLSMDYEGLWNHWYEDGAEETLRGLQKRASEASELGIEMPYKENLIEKWSSRVYSRLRPATTQ